MEKELFYSPFSFPTNAEYSYDIGEERLTRQQLKELQEELRRKKREYERENQMYISEERKEAVHGFFLEKVN